MANEKILIVEDDESIRDLIELTLKTEGYASVYTASNGADAIKMAEKYLPNLILLDIMMPIMDGLTVCSKLKKSENCRNIPIIMLSAKSEESDIVLGLELGANDYITKPFSRKILIARIRTQLRQVINQVESSEIRYLNLVINSEIHSAKLDGVELDLTLSEFEILRLFASHVGRVYTRNQIINRLKGDDYPVTERAIDVQIVNLRRKLGEFGSYIETIRGIGYKMKSGE